MRETDIIMNEAISCLIEKLGAAETEVFISTLLKEPFDYTEWQAEQFSGEKPDDFCDKAAQWSRENPAR